MPVTFAIPATAGVRDLELETLVAATAAARRSWQHLVRYVEPRLRLPLPSPPGVELRLLTWAPGQGTGFHDHGGSSCAFTVVQGTITEELVDDPHAPRLRTAVHRWSAGWVGSFTYELVHDMRNESRTGVITIHAYRPELHGIRHYDLRDGRLIEQA